MSDELALDARAGMVRGVVLAVNDGAPLQTVDVQTHDGVVRSAVEVVLPWGLVSSAPGGAIALLAAVGGDPADMMALGVAHPGARAGGAAAGTVGLADAGGNRVLVRPGGIAEVVVATRINLVVQGVTLEVTPAGITMTGTGATLSMDATGVTITGTLTVTGPIHGTADAALAMA